MVAFVSSLPTFIRRLPKQAFVFSPGNLRYDTGGNGISAVSLAWNWSVDNVGTMAFEVYLDNILASEVLYDVHYPGDERHAAASRRNHLVISGEFAFRNPVIREQDLFGMGDHHVSLTTSRGDLS